jgi:hypothetical protein
MKKKLLFILAVPSILLFSAGAVSAHSNQNTNCSKLDEGKSQNWKNDKCVNVCRQDENGRWLVLTVNKDDVLFGDFTYGGPTNKNGKPNENAASWCKENQPVYSCNSLAIKNTGTREVSASVDTTATNGAKVNTVTFDFGDKTTPDSSSSMSDSHTYGIDGTYTVTATVDFDVNGVDKTASCSQVLTVTTNTVTVNHTVQTTVPTSSTEVPSAPFQGK